MAFPLTVAAHSSYLSIDLTGLLSVTLNVIVYIVALDSISMTLKTRDSNQINMGITVTSVINSCIWTMYAIIINDYYVLIPNLASLCSAAIQLNLYKWTTGQLEHNHWLIKFLQHKFNVRGVKTLKVPKFSSPSKEYNEDDLELYYLNKKRDALKQEKGDNKGHNEK